MSGARPAVSPNLNTGNSPRNVATRIPFDDLNFEQSKVLGKGTFGTVRTASWRDFKVAVKVIETAAEQKAFQLEATNLARVSHNNIIKLYGSCQEDMKPFCLVMELAHNGSLSGLLHDDHKYPLYTAAHAFDWCLQCAKGVAYLHGFKPKPIVHRDLKPANLLLFNNATVLKICDFGTACDLHTYMSNSKGSAAWMAPEVFEGEDYSEKCDVFSWAILFWECLARRRPFEDLAGAAYRVLWAVHAGRRPPLIANCPNVLEKIMVQCWQKCAPARPSMASVVTSMESISAMFVVTPLRLERPTRQKSKQPGTLTDATRPSGGFLPSPGLGPRLPAVRNLQATPPSMSSSCGDIRYPSEHVKTPGDISPAQPALKFVPHHRRTGSHGSGDHSLSYSFVPNPANPRHALDHSKSYAGVTHVTGEDGRAELPLHHSVSWHTPGTEMDYEELKARVPPHLHPLPPMPTVESNEIFLKHVKMMETYLVVQSQVSQLKEQKSQLLRNLAEAEATVQNDEQLKAEYDAISINNEKLKNEIHALKAKLQEFSKSDRQEYEFVNSSGEIDP